MKVGRLNHQRQRGRTPHTGIAAIYKVSLLGNPQLIGTGFWVTDSGHLVTAWHVISDNIGANGIDEGPIYAMQSLADGTAIPRVLRKSYRHEGCDLALSETKSAFPDPTEPITMTLAEPSIGSSVYTHAFMSMADLSGPDYVGLPTVRFSGTLYVEVIDKIYNLDYGATLTEGSVNAVFKSARDKVMLPFPCFESSIPLYGANSGGPVFDKKGRICGINCSGIAGTEISYHIPLREVLGMRARNIEFVPEDPVARSRDILELGLLGRALFYPPVERYILPGWLYYLYRLMKVTRLGELKFEHVQDHRALTFGPRRK